MKLETADHKALWTLQPRTPGELHNSLARVDHTRLQLRGISRREFVLSTH